jgi:hypothetical protein
MALISAIVGYAVCTSPATLERFQNDANFTVVLFTERFVNKASTHRDSGLKSLLFS